MLELVLRVALVIAVAMFAPLVLIVVVFVRSRRPYWQNFCEMYGEWLGRAVHFSFSD